MAAIHSQLGNIYDDAGQLDLALHRYRESIRYHEPSGDLYGAAQTRCNAMALANAGCLNDAREQARAALRNFQTCGSGARDDVQPTLDPIAAIDQARS